MGKVNAKFLDQIICGDVLEVLPQIESESIDLICADPPYNLGKNYGKTIDAKEWHEYEDFTTKWLSECKRVLKPTGSIYTFMGVRFIAKLYLILEDMGFFFNGWITWHYTQGMGRTKGFSPRHEDILYFTKSKEFTFNLDEVRIPQKYYRQRNNMTGANPGDVWSFSHVHYCAEERKPHPTQKPEGAIERFQPAGLVIEVAEIVIHEGDEPDLIAHLFDADALAGEDEAEIDLLAVEADAAACGHADGLVVERVFEVRQAVVGAC